MGSDSGKMFGSGALTTYLPAVGRTLQGFGTDSGSESAFQLRLEVKYPGGSDVGCREMFGLRRLRLSRASTFPIKT